MTVKSTFFLNLQLQTAMDWLHDNATKLHLVGSIRDVAKKHVEAVFGTVATIELDDFTERKN